jgi:hypothetical protein
MIGKRFASCVQRIALAPLHALNWKPMNNIPQVLLVTLALATLTTNAQKLTTIRQIDFDNFSYPWSGAEPPEDVHQPWHWFSSAPDRHFRAVNGVHHFYLRDQDSYVREHSPLISVDSVTYGDLDGDGVEEAVVALNYSTGGTANWDYLYVYKLESGQPQLLARMRTGSRGYGGLVRAFVRNQLLIVDFADPERRVGDCCSEGYIRVRYRWQDGLFMEEGSRERGNLDLREGPPRPRFRDYRVKNIYHGEPAIPVITKEFRIVRTTIRRGAKSDVEFAGHFTVPRWGCGTDCNGFVIVDSISGKIYDGIGVHGLPFNWVEEHGDDAIERMEFYPNSRLLKINSCPNEENCGLYDYVMIDGKGLKLVRKELLPKEFQPPPRP